MMDYGITLDFHELPTEHGPKLFCEALGQQWTAPIGVSEEEFKAKILTDIISDAKREIDGL
jgi:hypothetical protein